MVVVVVVEEEEVPAAAPEVDVLAAGGSTSMLMVMAEEDTDKLMEFLVLEKLQIWQVIFCFSCQPRREESRRLISQMSQEKI